MTALGSPVSSDHIVSDGRVFCPKRGSDIDVETCWMCGRLISFDTDGDNEVIRCERIRLDELAAILP